MPSASAERDEVPAVIFPAVVVGHGSAAGLPVAPCVPTDDAVPAGKAIPVDDRPLLVLLHAADEPVAPEDGQAGTSVSDREIDASDDRHAGNSAFRQPAVQRN